MQRPSVTFSVHPSSGVPIYRQLMDQVQALVAGGKLVVGDTIPSVRQMAADLGVNMMTVSKPTRSWRRSASCSGNVARGWLLRPPVPRALLLTGRSRCDRWPIRLWCAGCS